MGAVDESFLLRNGKNNNITIHMKVDPGFAFHPIVKDNDQHYSLIQYTIALI